MPAKKKPAPRKPKTPTWVNVGVSPLWVDGERVMPGEEITSPLEEEQVRRWVKAGSIRRKGSRS